VKVIDIMRHVVRTAHPETDLATAGRVMAEVGCGFLPVVDESEKVLGVVTDRDVCLAVTRRDQQPSEIPVREVMSGQAYVCLVDEDIMEALGRMSQYRVRRLPVVDWDRFLVGLLSLDDIVLHARAVATEGFSGPFYADVARTLAAICGPGSPVVVR
jgi:CBS domain-containing protein